MFQIDIKRFFRFFYLSLYLILMQNRALGQESFQISSYETNAVLTQYHRWYLYYENDEYTLDHQIEILDPNIVIKSTATSQGIEAYKQGVAKFPKSWENAHHVLNTKVIKTEQGYVLEADIIYQNIGYEPDTRAAKIHYIANFSELKADGLPRFTSIELQQQGPAAFGDYMNAYPKNRVRSLMHNWLRLIEDTTQGSQRFRELLAAKFRLNFPTGPVDTDQGLEAWVANARGQIVWSQHDIKNFHVTANASNSYVVSADFSWQGKAKNGSQMKMKTRHNWQVIDNPKELFAKIAVMDVTILEPLTTVSAD